MSTLGWTSVDLAAHHPSFCVLLNTDMPQRLHAFAGFARRKKQEMSQNGSADRRVLNRCKVVLKNVERQVGRHPLWQRVQVDLLDPG